MKKDKSAERRGYRRHPILYSILVALGAAVLGLVLAYVPLLPHDLSPGTEIAAMDGRYEWGLPLDPTSPWPKFRANALQDGRSPVLPSPLVSDRPWTFQTGKGIFSSPVVDAEGTVYVGSADHVFYAVRRDGSLKWKFETGEIIDSAALLDDRGRVYFGSGDQHVYCLDRVTGSVIWSFKGQSVEEAQEEFGIKTYNVAWFEGNVGMLPDGSLLAGNDNYLVYAIDRDTGKRAKAFVGNEMVWSLPAVNKATGRMFFGTDFLAAKTLFAYDYRTGKRLWTAGGLGAVAATPLLTSEKKNGAVVLGGFDGYLRAYAQDSGKQLWKFGARDHIYASPARLSDGTIIQPAADGTVYAVDPRTGRQKWAFDTREPIRSSPAVGGDDRIYVGSGEGRLFCLEPDGRLRWSYRCIDEDRNDLNASPALGAAGVYLAGESGGVFYVPYDWPLSEAGRADPRSALGPKGDLPGEGDFLWWTTPFGALMTAPPAAIDANEPVTLSLFARRGGNTILSALDRDSMKVEVSGSPAMKVSVAANRRFLSLEPREYWTGPGGGKVEFHVTGTYTTGLSRFGLKFFGGRRGGRLDTTISLEVRPRTAAPMPYAVPARPGDPSSALEISRIAAPNPSMLPSWNQIGFDSLHYLAGAVERLNGAPDKAILWVVGGRLGDVTGGSGGSVVPNPELALRYPLVLEWDGGLVTLHNYDGFKINFVGSWDMPFGSFRISGRADPSTGNPGGRAALGAVALCDEIKFYGPGLKLMGMTEFDTGRMTVAGGARLSRWGAADRVPPPGVGAATFSATATGARVALGGSALAAGDHVYSLLLVDEASGLPLPLYYTKRTVVESDASGRVTAVSVDWDKGEAKGRARAYLMVDTTPAAMGKVEIPAGKK